MFTLRFSCVRKRLIEIERKLRDMKCWNMFIGSKNMIARNKSEIKPSDPQSTQNGRYQRWPEEEHVEIFNNFGGMWPHFKVTVSMEDLGYVRLLSRLFRFQATGFFIIILFFSVLIHSFVIPTFIAHFFLATRLRCRMDWKFWNIPMPTRRTTLGTRGNKKTY